MATQPPRHQVAPVAYQAHRTACQELLTKLQDQLNAHQQRQNQDPGNWGFVGDLSYVEDLLQQASDFLV